MPQRRKGPSASGGLPAGYGMRSKRSDPINRSIANKQPTLRQIHDQEPMNDPPRMTRDNKERRRSMIEEDPIRNRRSNRGRTGE